MTASDADDDDKNKLRFSIVPGNNQQHFKINASTGAILTNALLDFETTDMYNLVVRVEDRTHRVETDVKIRIVNINDNDPIFNPSSYQERIAENFEAGREFVTLNATDKDAFGGLTYIIVSGNTDSRFTLVPSSGKLQVAAGLDREITDFYNLTVRVNDGGSSPRFDTTFVEIYVTDINDNPPRFNTSREKVSLLENSRVGTPVLTVFAEDKDVDVNGEVRYNIIEGNDEGLFVLGETSGLLAVNGNIDRETSPSFRYIKPV